MKKRMYDESFKKMAVELSELKGSIKAAAVELDIDPGRISKWKHQYRSFVMGTISVNAVSDEQKEIRRLQKALREAQQERDILKKAVSIFSRGDGQYSNL